MSPGDRRRTDGTTRVADGCVDDARLEPARQCADRLTRQKRGRAGRAERVDEPRPQYLFARVGAGGERVGAVQQIGRNPELRRPAGQREGFRQLRALPCERGIDAAHERAGDRFGLGTIQRPFGRRLDPGLHPPRHCIALGEIGAEHFGEAALDGAAPQVHLKQPILRLDEALREKQIVAVPRVDVRHAVAIADDADRRAQAVHLDRSRVLWFAARRRRFAATARVERAQRDENSQARQRTTHRLKA